MSSLGIARCGRILAACVLALSATSAAWAEEASTQPGYTQALLKTREIDFRFKSETQRYRCEELAARIRAILAPLTQSVAIEMQCMQTLSSNVQARLSVTTPVEATAENVKRASEITPTQRLIARVRGETAEPRVEIFPAEWRYISLDRKSPARLAPIDCELLRALRTQVMPHLPVRHVRGATSCGSLTPPQLGAQVLLPANPDVDALTRDAG